MTDWSYDAWPAVEPKWHDGAHRGPFDRLDFHVDLGCGTLKKGRIGIDRYPAPGVNVVMDLDRGLVVAAAPAPGRDAADLVEHVGWRYHTPFGAPVDQMHYPTPHQEIGAWEGYRRAQHHSEAYVIGHGLPFADNSIESIISHHALEHVGEGFIPLMDDIYRVLVPDGIFRAITPLFPSNAAVADPDHCRYFMEDTWLSFCGHMGDANNPTGSWLDSFSVPYTKCRFEMLDKDVTKRCEPEKHWTGEDSREIRVAFRAVKH